MEKEALEDKVKQQSEQLVAEESKMKFLEEDVAWFF